MFGDVLHPELDEGRSSSIPRASLPTPKRRGISGTALCDGQAGLHGRRPFQCRLSGWPSCVPSIRRSIAGVPARDLVRAAIVSRPRQAGRADGCAFADGARQGSGPLSVHAFERFRTADAVRRAGGERRSSPMRWLPPSSPPRSSRVPEPAEPRWLRARPARGRSMPRNGSISVRGRLLPHADAPNLVISAGAPLAFTVAPHLQTINYRGRFSRFVGI